MDFITELLLAIGAGISLLLEYVPWVRTQWDTLEPKVKQWVSLGLMFGITLGAYGLACWTTILAIECPDPDLLSFVRDLVVAIVANQGVHSVTKRRTDPLGY